MNEKVLEVKNLEINFKTDNGMVHAVRDVSFDLYKGETLCIVGESGSGKSVTSKAIMGILSNNAIVEGGHIYYEGEDLLKISEEEFHRIRGHKIGMIFQDPLSSLNPIVKIGKQITEATLVNGNKLKLKYNELISNNLTKYRNKLVHQRVDIEDVRRDFGYKKEEILKEIAEKIDKNEIKALKEKLSQLKKDANTKILAIKEAYKAPLLELKEKLAVCKKEAKVEVSKYKSQLISEYNKNLKVLKEKLANASENNKKKILDEIKDLKDKHVNSLKVTKKVAKERALKIMEEVGIPMPERRFKQYPFEFSGGMRQRIVIAIALTADPDILICDEPTTALDVTIQAQILELINKLKVERNLSCIFITHDLGVVANMADRVAVMYAGKIVEYGTVNEIFFDPKHPYTWALLSSIPDVDSKEKLDAIPGTPPNMIYPPKGDAFALRSKYALEIDTKYEPPYFKVSDTHYAATWLLHKDAPKVEMPKIVSERIKAALKEAKQ